MKIIEFSKPVLSVFQVRVWRVRFTMLTRYYWNAWKHSNPWEKSAEFGPFRVAFLSTYAVNRMSGLLQ